MVISFQLENVRNHLLKHGVVYTLRPKPHKVGLDWANSGRTTKKIADVNITEIKFKSLYQYLKHSGFDCVADWLVAYNNLCHDALKNAHLYKVGLVKKFHTTEELFAKLNSSEFRINKREAESWHSEEM